MSEIRRLPTTDPSGPVVVSFNVPGLARPKGSLVRYRGHYVETTKGLAEWMAAVTIAAGQERVKLGRSLVGPLRLDVVVRLPMPGRRPAGSKRLAAGGSRFPSRVRPDWDKLGRAIGDALTRSGLIVDDAEIADGRVAKYEVLGWVGVEIDLEEIRS